MWQSLLRHPWGGGACSIAQRVRHRLDWTRAGFQEEGRDRLAVARILVAGRLLEGKTEEEVVALLGPPDARAGENPAYLGWRLGRFESRASLMFPYEFHLDLTLEGGKVTAAQVINMD